MQLKTVELPAGRSFEDLFAAKDDEAHRYFAAGSTHPFRSDAVSFDLLNASYMADLALLAYLEPDQLAGPLERGNMELVAKGFVSRGRPIGFRAGGTQGFVASGAGFVVLCFRGTQVEEPRDILADIDAKLVRGRGFPGRVHRGFRNALDEVWPDVHKHLAEGMEAARRKASDVAAEPTLWVTGHSLGAALATLASARLPGSQSVYTFGSPRVGNARFRAKYGERQYRFANQSDLVTMVPPRVEGGYEHVGDLKYISEDASPFAGRIVDEPKNEFVTRDRLEAIIGSKKNWRKALVKAFRAPQTPEYLVDHSPQHYAIKVWNEFVRTHAG